MDDDYSEYESDADNWDTPDLSPRRICRVEVTPENVNQLIIDYFSVEPYTVVYPKKGGPIKIPCDVPTLDGFSASYNIGKSRVEPMLSPETVEICLAKFKHIVMVNGTSGLYNPGFTGLMMKNEAGWAEKSEVKTVAKRTLTITDRILDHLTTDQLEKIRMDILTSQMVIVDGTATDNS